ncbi:unnamed protein product [Heligmosomoides polygyrus]|uniref:F-box protein n=1 Tax=Heligmosomoides polygyrus TaxID=6339 RepID=A0A183G4T3_HELPZ|nr:unnamed protein product [Heligmosomoides polygyrus]
MKDFVARLVLEYSTTRVTEVLITKDPNLYELLSYIGYNLATWFAIGHIIWQDPCSSVECGCVDGLLMRVGRSSGAKNGRFLCGAGDEVVLLQVKGHRTRPFYVEVLGPPMVSDMIVSERFRDAIASVERFDDSLMKIVVAVEERRCHFFSAYAPHSGCSEQSKDEFWSLLDENTAKRKCRNKI